MVGGITINSVTKAFVQNNGEHISALQNINLSIAPGSFVTLIGPSGCGKSTLLRLVAGLIPPDQGEMYIDETEIVKPGNERGFVFQEHALFPWLNIQQNVAFGLAGQKQCPKEEVSAWIKIVGLQGFEKSFPHQLSGGMCQRAALARALIARPKVLMLDEPFGALDAFTRMHMQTEILRIWQEHQTTMIMVTHDVDEAIYVSDQVAVLSPRPGKIDQVIDIKLSRPRARNDENFIAYRKQLLERLDFGGHIPDAEYNI